MPNRPRSPCTEPGCPELVDRPGKCPAHRRDYDRELKRRHTWRNYGGDWPKIRAQVLAEEPLCPCGARATDVDHVVPLRRGGTHQRSNLQPLCKPCHASKSAKER